MAKNKKKRELKNKKSASQLAVLENNKSTRGQRKAEKYVQKNKQKVEPIPNKISASQLAEWKLKLEPVVYEANTRIQMIQHAGYTSYALDRVIREGDGRDYFDLEDITTREDLIAENTRMRIFLNDAGSTMEGSRLETAQIYSDKYRGKFGNQYKNQYGVSFDASVIDPEIAKMAFENYRRIEEDRAAIIGKQGMPGVYGSENLFIAIYDAEIRGKDSLMYGKELLDAFEAQSSDFVEEQQQTANEVTSISGLIEHQMRGGKLF